MPRASASLLRQLAPLKSSYTWSSTSPAVYSIGVSYAGKDSPPFVPSNSKYPRTGFANLPTGKSDRIREWVRNSLKYPAGRGELDSAVAGGWTEAVRERVGKWGAGEDFFAIETPGSAQSDTYLPDDPSSSSESRSVHLAISDGVGGWSDTVDPSFFSQGLMHHYARSAASRSADGSSSTPLDHLRQAYEGVLKEEIIVAGGATACGVSLSPDGLLSGVNLGDSGCIILRDGEIVYSTPVGTHYFNCPKQLSKIPASMRQQGIITDTPDSAGDTFSAHLQPGDVIMLYTDGLSDNVPSSHFAILLSHLRRVLDQPDNAHLTYLDRAAELARLYADVLVGHGRTAMCRTGDEMEKVDGKVRRAWRTPFEVEAAKEGMRYKGGKVDDITVITAVVSEKNPETE